MYHSGVKFLDSAGRVAKYTRNELHKKEEDHFLDDWDGKKVPDVVDTAFASSKDYADSKHKKRHA